MSDESILLQHLFHQSDIGEVKDGQIADLVRQYPYFAHARWFKALKSNDRDTDLPIAGVFTARPLRLIRFLHGTPPSQKEATPAYSSNQPSADHTEAIKITEAESGKGLASEENTETRQNHAQAPLIQPLYTSDYFAYTGDKLPDHIEDDKKPTMEQLHSFTGWLRTLKRSQGITDPDLQSDEASMAARMENENAGLMKNAEEPVITSDEVLTEAMAEVRVSKGQTDKAIAIYEKLSLHNPEKSAYFAQKIADLKNI